jgi:hypothetical protein
MEIKYGLPLLVLVIVFIAGCTSLYRFNLIQDLEPNQTAILRGVVKTGEQLGLDYCPEPLYLEDDTGYVQLDIKDENYLGKEVIITGEYVVPRCQTLCVCDPRIVVTTITQELHADVFPPSSQYLLDEKYCEQDSDCTLRDNCCNSCYKDYVNIYNKDTIPIDQCPIRACKEDCPDLSIFKEPVCVNSQCVPKLDEYKSLCEQEVKGSGLCDAYFIGYHYDSSLGKCVQKGVSGCSFESPFNSLEECQIACEEDSLQEIQFTYMGEELSCIRLSGSQENEEFIINSDEEYSSLLELKSLSPACEDFELPIIDFSQNTLLGKFTTAGGCSVNFIRNIYRDNSNKKILYSTGLVE